MNAAALIRPATAADLMPAYALFRRALYAYLAAIGMVDAAAAKDPPIASAWDRQADWITHLWNCAHLNVVAVTEDGSIAGWALSTLRDQHLGLSFFFVDPTRQSAGLGRALIAQAFPALPGIKRSIVATQDPRALSLYLRSGVAVLGTSADFLAKVWPPGGQGDLTFERLAADDAAVAAIGQIDASVLGFRRDADIRFLLTSRPAWLARRAGKPVGYVFGIQPNPPGTTDIDPGCGPMAALDPSDLAALIDQVMTDPGGAEKFSITLPLANHSAIAHLLAHGAHIDPFYTVVLTDAPALHLDRYVQTSPSFIL